MKNKIIYGTLINSLMYPVVAYGINDVKTSCNTSQNDEIKYPNIVIIIGDDCSYSDLSCYGSPNAITPNIEKLASQGMLFNNCFQATAMSSPTRHCLYTGLYPLRSGAYPNHTFVKKGVKSFVQYFKQIGYNTALYGKEHVAPKSVFSYDYLGNYKESMDFDILKTYILNSSEIPFILVVASNEPHGPYTKGNPENWNLKDLKLPPHYIDTPIMRKQYRNYLAEIEVLDKQVGEIMNLLDETNNTNNTILVFLSEQGNSFPFAKWTCYNQGLHSGLIVRYPEHIKRGVKTDALVEYVDILPTLLDFVNYKERDDNYFDGQSFYDVLVGDKDNHKQYAYGIHTTRGVNSGSDNYGIRSVTDGHFCYILNLTPQNEFQCGINKSEEKDNDMFGWIGVAKGNSSSAEFAQKQIYRFRHRPAEELYDLKNDPYSLNNLINNPKYKGIIRQMRIKLKKWMKEQEDEGEKTELKAYEHMCDWARSKKKYNAKF